MTNENPSNGYVINDSSYGTIFIGEDSDTKGRIRQIEIHSASDGCIKLFKDSGFELQSQTTASSDNIISRSKDGLFVAGKNIHLDAKGGTITLSAREIRFESTASDQTFKISANKNLELNADNVKITGSEVAIGAKNRMLLRSSGPIYINSDAGVSIVEPKLSLTPTNLLSLVQTLSTNVFGF